LKLFFAKHKIRIFLDFVNLILEIHLIIHRNARPSMTKTIAITAIILGVATIMVFSSIAPVLVVDAGAPQGHPGLKFCVAADASGTCAFAPTGKVFVAVDTDGNGLCDIGPFVIPERLALRAGITGSCVDFIL